MADRIEDLSWVYETPQVEVKGYEEMPSEPGLWDKAKSLGRAVGRMMASANPMRVLESRNAKQLGDELYDAYSQVGMPLPYETRSPQYRKWEAEREPGLEDELFNRRYAPPSITRMLEQVASQLNEQEETGVKAYDADQINWPAHLANYMATIEKAGRRIAKAPWWSPASNDKSAQAVIDAETQINTNPVFRAIFGDSPAPAEVRRRLSGEGLKEPEDTRFDYGLYRGKDLKGTVFKPSPTLKNIVERYSQKNPGSEEKPHEYYFDFED